MRTRKKFFILEILVLVIIVVILATTFVVNEMNKVQSQLESNGKEISFRTEEALITYSSLLKALGYNFMQDSMIEKEKFYSLSKFYKDRYPNILYFQYQGKTGAENYMFPELNAREDTGENNVSIPSSFREITITAPELTHYLNGETLTLNVQHPVFTRDDVFSGTFICTVDVNGFIQGITQSLSNDYNLTLSDAQGNIFVGKDIRHSQLHYSENLIIEGTVWILEISLKNALAEGLVLKVIALMGGLVGIVSYVVYSQYRIYRKDSQLESVNEELEASLLKLKASHKRLIEAEKVAALGRLVASVSHELNTPLGNCIMMNDFLNEQNEEMEMSLVDGSSNGVSFSEYFKTLKNGSQVIVAGLNRMAVIVDRFKDLAVTNIKDDRVDFDLTSVLEDRLIQYRYKHHFKWQIDAEPVMMMNGVLVAYEEIFNNLISNSLEHGFKNGTAEEPTIMVQLRRKERGLEIRYQDNGCGIDAELLDRVIEPLFSTSLTGGCGGIGLNLILNHLHYTLGGELQLSSPEGEGLQLSIVIGEVDWI